MIINEAKKRKILRALAEEIDSEYLQKCTKAERERDNHLTDLLVDYAQNSGPFEVTKVEAA